MGFVYADYSQVCHGSKCVDENYDLLALAHAAFWQGNKAMQCIGIASLLQVLDLSHLCGLVLCSFLLLLLQADSVYPFYC